MFKITSFGELSGWRPVEMDMEHSLQNKCPCCDIELMPTCALKEPGNYRYWSVCSCRGCGYVGYGIRPTRQWFRDFYASEWDGQARDNQEYVRQLVREAAAKEVQPGVAIALACKPDKGSRILEFGCGYGVSLAQLHKGGYTEVIGVEPCQHRAGIARSEFGLGVADDIGNVSGQFDVICSSHVLEHCYDPGEIIGHCARLQPSGGRLAINVPNAWQEPTMGQLLFLPHLHSFTMLSLSNLMARHGYELTSVQHEGGGLFVLGIKNGDGQMRQHSDDATVRIVNKFREALSVGGQQLWWNSENDETAPEPKKDWKRPRCINIEPCGRVTGHPLEIQFEGPVQLCVK